MIMSTVSNFFLSEWLWSVTFDWYHIPIAILFMCIVFRFALRIGIIPAVLITFFAHLYGFAVFSLFVVGVLSYLLNVTYNAASYAMPTPLLASLYLGFIYTILESSFFLIVSRWYTLRVIPMVIVTLLCNVAASCVTFYLFSSSLLM